MKYTYQEQKLHKIGLLLALPATVFLINACNHTTADPCKDVTCNGVGVCNVVNDKAVCVCQDGYDADGPSCVANWCKALGCAHGSCELNNNSPYCKCEEGYLGAKCDECAPNYAPYNGSCIASGVDPSKCDPNPCENDPCIHGLCRCQIENGTTAPVCLCDDGYTGKNCQDCAPGYAPDGLNCVFDNCQVKQTILNENDEPTGTKISYKCDNKTCGNGGTCSCDPISGIAVCDCQHPYTGEYCTDCLYGYVMKNGKCEKAPPCNVITFTYESTTASNVKLGGDWLGCTTWADCAQNMTKDEHGIWSITITIPEGGRHQYKFNINNSPNNWAHDPSNPNQVDDGFGGKNNYIDVCSVCNITPDPCDNETCSYNGGCSCTMENGTPKTSCICAEGYAGAHCNECASGYARNATTGRCISSYCGNVEEFDWRDAVLYFVMTDRFYDSDGQAKTVSGATNDRGLASAQYLGGDWKGVTDKMSYLADLGVTAIWLGAPYKNRDTIGAGTTSTDTAMYSSYHGYWPSPKNTDYSNLGTGDNINTQNVSNPPVVEDRLGSKEDLHELINAAHTAKSANGHGIKILFDYVMNHVDVDSGLYRAHQNSNWFAKDNGNIRLCASNCGQSDCWNDDYWMKKCAFTDYLIPFDYDVTEPRKWSVDDALWWAKEYNIDGYRLDAIKHVPMVWLTDFRNRFNDAYPNPAGGRFYLVGETYDWGNRELIGKFVNPDTMLDGQFDFPARYQICDAVLNDGWMSNLANWMQGNDTYYTKGALMSTFLGNHDMPRVIHAATKEVGCTQGSFIGDDGRYNSWTSDQFKQPTNAEPYQKLAVAFAALLMNPGLPLIYYGDEIGMAGGGDPDNRRMMIWDDSQLNDHQKELRSKVKALANIRGQQKALTRGKRTTISSTESTWVYKMGGCGSPDAPDIIVALNKSGSEKEVSISGGQYIDLYAQALGSAAEISGDKIKLPPYGIKVLTQKQ